MVGIIRVLCTSSLTVFLACAGAQTIDSVEPGSEGAADWAVADTAMPVEPAGQPSRAPAPAPTSAAAPGPTTTGIRLDTVATGPWFATGVANARISSVRSWIMVGALPDLASIETSEPASDWDRQLFAQARARGVAAATFRQLDCYARQHGAFFLSYGGWPTQALETFIAGRCGLVATLPRVFHRVVPGDATVETARAAYDEVVSALADTPPSWHVAYQRSDGATATVHTIVYAEHLAQVDPYALGRRPGEKVEITGTLPPGSAAIRALSTLGSVDWNSCRFRVRRASGEFRLRCVVDWTRPTTVVEASYGARRARVTRGSVMRLLLSNGPPPDRFLIESISSDRVGDPVDRNSVLEALNVARSRAGVSRLPEDSARSVSADRLWHDDGSPRVEDIADLAYFDLGNDRREAPRGVAVWRASGHATAGQLVDETLVQPLTRAWLLAGTSKVALSVRTTAGDMSTNVLVVGY